MVAALPESLGVPSCASIIREDTSWADHQRVSAGFRETIYFSGTVACMDAWANSLSVNEVDKGPLYFEGDETAYAMVVRVVEASAPAGNRMFIQWQHGDPIDGVEYYDNRDSL